MIKSLSIFTNIWFYQCVKGNKYIVVIKILNTRNNGLLTALPWKHSGRFHGRIEHNSSIFVLAFQTDTFQTFLEIFPEILTENAIKNRIRGRVYVSNDVDNGYKFPCFLKSCVGDSIVKEQHLWRSVAHCVHNDARYQHFDHAFPGFNGVASSVRFAVCILPHLKLGVKFTSTHVQTLPYDRIQHNLNTDWDKIKQSKFGKLVKMLSEHARKWRQT